MTLDMPMEMSVRTRSPNLQYVANMPSATLRPDLSLAGLICNLLFLRNSEACLFFLKRNIGDALPISNTKLPETLSW